MQPDVVRPARFPIPGSRALVASLAAAAFLTGGSGAPAQAPPFRTDWGSAGSPAASRAMMGT